MTGTISGYTQIQQQNLECGRSIQGPDEDNHLNVAVVNYELVQSIMHLEDVREALGHEIYLY